MNFSRAFFFFQVDLMNSYSWIEGVINLIPPNPNKDSFRKNLPYF